MAAPTFDRVLWLSVCTYGSYLPAQFLRVVQGGYASYYGNEDAYYNATDQDNVSSHDGGNVVMDDRGCPMFVKTWRKTTGYGGWSWNPDNSTFERVMDYYTASILWFRIGDKYGWGQSGGLGSQSSDLYYNYHAPVYSAATLPCATWASFSNTVLLAPGTAAATYVWGYPFTGIPGTFGTTIINRIIVHNGKFYGLRTDTTNGFYIYEYSGGVWVQKILQADAYNSALVTGTSGCAANAFIPYGGYFYVILGHTSTGSAQMVTCWKVDPVGWTASNVTSTFVPNGSGTSGVNWTQVNPKGSVHPRLQEIPYVDTTGVLRYVIVQGWTIGSATYAGWSAVVFHDVVVDGKWADICIGTELLHGANGIIWDIDAGHTQIVGLVDHGTYIEIQHKCSHPNNKNIDVGIRYQSLVGNDDDGAPCTPYTGDPAHEGDTNLTTKPTTPVSLAALSDTFSGSFDETKFMKCNAALDWVASAYGWYGLGGRGAMNSVARSQYPIVQQSGGIYFGSSSTAGGIDANSGAAVALRWMMTGDFRVDLTLDRMYPGTTNLQPNASNVYAMFAVVLAAANKGFGWVITSASGTNFLGTGLYFQENGSCVIKAGAHVLADTNVMRISRSSGAMSIIADQGGANEDITPATPPTLTGPMQLIFGAMVRTGGSAVWCALTLGPGFSDLLISDAAGGAGTGQVGKYKGYVTHKFMWDAMTDLGAVNKAVNFLSYFKQNNP